MVFYLGVLICLVFKFIIYIGVFFFVMGLDKGGNLWILFVYLVRK